MLFALVNCHSLETTIYQRFANLQASLPRGQTGLRVMPVESAETFVECAAHCAAETSRGCQAFTVNRYIQSSKPITRRFSEWRFRDWQNGGQILTYWWFSDFFFFWKKGLYFFPSPHRFHLKTFPTPHGCQKLLKLPLTGFFYPWRELIFSLKKLFLTPNWLQIGKNGLNWPSFFYCNLTLLSWFG